MKRYALKTFLLSLFVCLLGCGDSNGSGESSLPRGPENGYAELVTASDSESINNHLRRWLAGSEGPGSRRINFADDKRNYVDSEVVIFDSSLYQLDDPFLEQLARFTNIEWLRMGNRTTRDQLEVISGLKKLKGLDLGEAPLSLADAKLLENFPDLRWLRMHAATAPENNKVDFPDLQKVEVLFAKGEPFVKACLQNPKKLPKVRTFTAGNAGLTDADIQSIVENWPGLEYLSIANNDQLTSNSIEYLAKLKKLRHLDIGGTELEKQFEKVEKALPRCAVVK